MLFKRTRASSGPSKAAQKEVDLPTPPDSTADTASEILAATFAGKDPDFGTSASIKVFYEGKNSGRNNINWVETPPKQLNEKVARANNRVAIKIFKLKDHEQPTISGKTPLKIHEVEIQSAILVAVLKDIVKHEGMYLETTESAKFQEPFKPLFFSYDKIMALYDSTKSGSILKQHLKLLVQVMDEMFGSFMTHLKHLNASKLISYKLAWTYFRKNSMLFCPSRDAERIFRVVSTSYEMHPCPHMRINCEEVGFDGETFVWKPTSQQFPAFSGNLPVTELPVYPLEFHDDPEGVKERLRVRAKKALDYQELTYCEYTGVGLLKTACGMQRHNVSIRNTSDLSTQLMNCDRSTAVF